MESEGKLKLVEKLKGMQAQLQVRLTAVRELKPILRKVKFEEEIKAAQKKLAELADPPIAALESSLALNRARQCDLRDEEAAICSQLQELRSSAKQAAKDAAEAQHVRVDWTGTFEWDAAVRDMLKSRFGHDSFRPLQREVINATLSRRDTFAILPTGSGKSVNSNSCSEPSAAPHRSRADRRSCNDSRPCSCSSSSRACFLRLV